MFDLAATILTYLNEVKVKLVLSAITQPGLQIHLSYFMYILIGWKARPN